MPSNIDNETFRALLRSFPAKAVDILYRTFFKRLVRYSEALTHNRETSIDIVQDAFIHVWQNHVALSQPHKQSIQAYLVNFVKKKSINEYLQAVRHQELLHLAAPPRINGHPVDREIIRAEIQIEVRALIETFPARERQCLFLKLDKEMNAAQIAAELKISVKAVEKSITSGNKRLRMHFRNRR